MNNSNRDLLVLFDQASMSPKAVEHEVDVLHQLLYRVEHSIDMLTAHEVINLNKYKIISDPVYVKKILRRKTLKPFIFLNNKN